MDGAGDELLADAGLAPDEDGGIGVGDLIDHLLDGLHAGAVLEDPVVLGAAPLELAAEHLLAELLDLPLQRRPFLLAAREGSRHVPRRLIVADDDQFGRPDSGRHRRLDRVEQHLAVERLAQVRGDAGSPDSLGGRRIVMGGDEDHGDPGAVHRQPLLKLEPAHPTQTEIQDQTGRAGEPERRRETHGRTRTCRRHSSPTGPGVGGPGEPTDRRRRWRSAERGAWGHGARVPSVRARAPRAPVDFGPLAPEPEGV